MGTFEGMNNPDLKILTQKQKNTDLSLKHTYYSDLLDLSNILPCVSQMFLLFIFWIIIRALGFFFFSRCYMHVDSK